MHLELHTLRCSFFQGQNGGSPTPCWNHRRRSLPSEPLFDPRGAHFLLRVRLSFRVERSFSSPATFCLDSCIERAQLSHCL